MGFLRRSLTAKLLILFLLLAIVPLTVAGYLAYEAGRQSIVDHVEAHLESVAILKEQETENWVKHLEHAVTWLATSAQTVSDAAVLATHTAGDPDYLAARDSVISEFNRIAALGDVSGLFLLDRSSGQIIASTGSREEGRFKRDEQYFIQGRERTYISGIFHSSSLDRPTMVVSTPVKDSDGQLLGVMAAYVNLEHLTEIMVERSGLGETGETYLVNKSNLLLTESRLKPGVVFRTWIFTEGVSRALKGESGVGHYLDYREEPVIGAYRWLEDRNMALLAEVDQAEALAPIVALGRAIFGFGATIGLVAALLGVFFARTITEPVRLLVRGAEEIGRGNLDHKVGTMARDEIGELSRAFDGMTENLRLTMVSRDELVEEVAERKQAEEKIRSLFESATDGIFALDTNGLYTDVNKGFLEMHGLSSKEAILGKSGPEFFGQRDLEKMMADLQKTLEQGAVTGLQYTVARADGSQFPVEVSAAVLRGASGDPVGIIGISRDITERKRAEERLKRYSERLEEMVDERTRDLREAQEELVRKEKLAVLGQLAGGIGHELRNPLGAINNAAYFLDMALEEPEPEVKQTLDILQKEVGTCSRIISSLLDLARAKAPIQRKMDVNEIVRKVLARAAVPESVEVVSQLDDALPIVMADPDQLEQVFSNIVLNAVQAMPEGGQLVIKSEARKGEGVHHPGWVAVSVMDTGVGIPEENLEKVFEPLFTTKARGIGLGLAVVKTLLEAHGGSVEVESEAGKGSTFTVKLPCDRREGRAA